LYHSERLVVKNFYDFIFPFIRYKPRIRVATRK
jgi:hypothetical protein